MESLSAWDDDGLMSELASIREAAGLAPAAPGGGSIDLAEATGADLTELEQVDPVLEQRMAEARKQLNAGPAPRCGAQCAAQCAAKTVEIRRALSKIAKVFATQTESLQDALEEAAVAIGARARVDEATVTRRAEAHKVRLAAIVRQHKATDAEFTCMRRTLEEVLSDLLGDQQGDPRD